MDDEEAKSKFIADLPMPIFIKAMKIALWADQGKELGLELTYIDEEVMLFKKLTEPSET